MRFRPGDTIEITVTPQDASGNAVTLSSMTVTITGPSGPLPSLSYPGDFSQNGSSYVASYTLPNEEGTVKFDISATDSLGNTKREIVYVILDAD